MPDQMLISGEFIGVRCPKDGQVEWIEKYILERQQASGFKPWTFCGFCSKHLVFPKVEVTA